jgi:hypothetical protein
VVQETSAKASGCARLHARSVAQRPAAHLQARAPVSRRFPSFSPLLPPSLPRINAHSSRWLRVRDRASRHRGENGAKRIKRRRSVDGTLCEAGPREVCGALRVIFLADRVRLVRARDSRARAPAAPSALHAVTRPLSSALLPTDSSKALLCVLVCVCVCGGVKKKHRGTQRGGGGHKISTRHVGAGETEPQSVGAQDGSPPSRPLSSASPLPLLRSSAPATQLCLLFPLPVLRFPFPLPLRCLPFPLPLLSTASLSSPSGSSPCLRHIYIHILI